MDWTEAMEFNQNGQLRFSEGEQRIAAWCRRRTLNSETAADGGTITAGGDRQILLSDIGISKSHKRALDVKFGEPLGY